MKSIHYVLILLFIFSACKDAKSEKVETAIEPEQKEVAEKKAELKIYPIEHATAVLQWGETTIYIDPYGGKEAFESHEDPDLILITDIHGDHFHLETLEALNTSNAKIMAPAAVAEKMPDQFAPQIDVLNNGDSKERYGITVEAIPMYNLREEAKKFHEKGRGNGYVLNIDGQRLYFSGDTEDIPEMRALENIDKAFICMNLPYTMTVESAADAVLEFKPIQVYPYHYRGRPDVSDVNIFRQIVEGASDDIEVVQLDWYPNDEF